MSAYEMGALVMTAADVGALLDALNLDMKATYREVSEWSRHLKGTDPRFKPQKEAIYGFVALWEAWGKFYGSARSDFLAWPQHVETAERYRARLAEAREKLRSVGLVFSSPEPRALAPDAFPWAKVLAIAGVVAGAYVVAQIAQATAAWKTAARGTA